MSAPLTTRDTPSARPARTMRTAPLTYHQERLWFIDEFERGRVYAGSPTYHNIPILLRIDGSLDLPALQAALRTLALRHEILRANIARGRQRIRATLAIAVTVTYAPAWNEADIVARALSDSRLPFHLARGPLVRAALYRAQDDDARSLLAVTLHHVVADLESTRILVTELVELYRARLGGREPVLAAPGRFSAYAEWHRALPEATFDAVRAFWEWQLQGGVAPLELPYRQTRHHVHRYASAMQRFSLDAGLVRALDECAARASATRADLLLAAWVAALHTCSRQREIVVGTSHPDRHASLERMVGPLANLLVLRCQVDRDQPFDELLRQVSRTTRLAAANRAMPFDRLVQILSPAKDMSRTALFDVLFQYLDPEPCFWQVPGAAITRLPSFVGFGKYDLNMTLYQSAPDAESLASVGADDEAIADDEAPRQPELAASSERHGVSSGCGRAQAQALFGDLEFNAELFDERFIRDLHRLYETILTRIAGRATAAAMAASAAPAPASSATEAIAEPALAAVTVRELTMLPASIVDDQRALLRDEQAPAPPHATLDAAFDASVARGPDRIAIVAGGAQISYRGLAARADRIARELIAAGVRPCMPVAILLERSIDTIAAMLGILRVGAAYVPIDPSAPRLRTLMMLDDADTRVVVTTRAIEEGMREELASRGTRIVTLTACGDAPAVSMSARRMRSRAWTDAVAYSIYTSGSTGRPKGCLVTHRNVLQLMFSEAGAFGFGDADVWLWAHSPAFDFSVWEIFGALLHGGRGVLLSAADVRDPAIVEQALVRESVTVLNQTPAAGYRLLQRLLEADTSLPGLRWLIFGGDRLLPRRLAAWSRAQPQTGIVNMYGITETTVHVTHKRLSAEELAADSRSVGRALPNVTLALADARGEPLPTGVRGEIGVGGAGVSLGYWRRSDLTAERFVPDPFSAVPGARMYRSGDGGRLTADGELTFEGRLDTQVKIRGHRIELAEIEAVLADAPGVAEAAVIAKEDAAGHRSLAAFVCAAAGAGDVDTAAVRAHLQARLTPVMVPALIQAVPVLPKTSSGKIDRKALAGMTQAAPPSRRRYAPARTDLERALVRIWEEVLARAPIGIRDDFFEIGGDSILCMQICARAARLRIALTPKLLFEHVTIEELARAATSVRAPRRRARSSGQAPLLPAQAWFFAQRHADPHQFNQAAWFDLAPDITAADVRAALRRLRARHEALRLVFTRTAEGIVQELRGRQDELPLTVHTPRVDAAAPREQELLAAANRLQRGLDIHAGPLFGALFVPAFENAPPRLLLVFHHLIVDSVSWRTLVDDLDLLLAARGGAPRAVLPPAASLIDHACARAGRDVGADTGVDAGADVSVDVIADGKVDGNVDVDVDVEADDAASAFGVNTYGTYDEVSVALSAAATTRLAQRLSDDGLSWIDAIVAAVGDAAARWAGGSAAALYIETHGRDLASGDDLSRIVGWFTKVYRVHLNGASTRSAVGAPAAQPIAAERDTARRALHDAHRALARLDDAPDLLERAFRAIGSAAAPGALDGDGRGAHSGGGVANVGREVTADVIADAAATAAATAAAADIADAAVADAADTPGSSAVAEPAHDAARLPFVPGICVNYLGQIDALASGTRALAFRAADTGEAIGPRNRRAQRIDVGARLQQGQLHIHWGYSTALDRRGTIERLAADCVRFLERAGDELPATGAHAVAASFAAPPVRAAESESASDAAPASAPAFASDSAAVAAVAAGGADVANVANGSSVGRAVSFVDDADTAGSTSASEREREFEPEPESDSGSAHAVESTADRDNHARTDAYPLAPGQVGMLYHALLRPGDAPEYVIRLSLAITGQFDAEAFRAAWRFLLARHDALRASFHWDGPDGPVQRFADRADLPCTQFDWRDTDARTGEIRLRALAEEIARQGVALDRPPLIALDIVRTGETEHRVFLRIHHLVVDGWSIALLRDELTRAYDAFSKGRTPDLPPAGRFRDYLDHLARLDTGAAREFWRQRLEGARPCRLPAPAAKTTMAAAGAAAAGNQAATDVIDSDVLDAVDWPLARNRGLMRWAARHRVTLNTVVQGLWSLVVGALTDRDTAIVGVIVAGRPRDLPDVERTVGSFIGTLPLRTELSAAEPLADWLRRLQEEGLDAQRVGFWSMPQMAAWAGLSSDTPLFDTVLVCQNYPMPRPPRTNDIVMREAGYSLKESVPLVLEYACVRRLICRLRYRRDLVSASIVRDAAELLRTAVEEVDRVRDPSVPGLAARLRDTLADARQARAAQFTSAYHDALQSLHPRRSPAGDR